MQDSGFCYYDTVFLLFISSWVGGVPIPLR